MQVQEEGSREQEAGSREQGAESRVRTWQWFDVVRE
jgi:hypothetical protein